jgi:peptidoglycan/xylan/chitin deacetylase (PgdA/CDA1 family)
MQKQLGVNDTTFVTDLFRPPYGRITRKQINMLAADYRIVMWDVLSVDYNKNLSPEACLRNTIRAARPGSIIVFHDSIKAEKNMTYVLPRLLDHFSQEGYTFKSLHG